MPVISPSDAARAALVAKADGWFWGLIWSTVVLFIGAIMEEISPLDKLHTHIVNTRTRVRTPRTWVTRSQSGYKKLAIILVVAGIAGEGFCEFFGAKAETAVRNFDEGIAAKAELDAGTAAVSAKRAEDSARAAHAENEAIKKNNETIAKEQDHLTMRLATASSELGEIEHKVRVQSPRGPRLEAAKTKFIEAMKPFAGQLYTVVDCGDSANRPPESLRLESDLVTFLGPDGAGWKVSSNVLREWPRCSSVVSPKYVNKVGRVSRGWNLQ